MRRSVPAISLDQLATRLSLMGPFLLKVDVQGAELSVLAGADQILAQAEYVLLEVSFFRFFAGGPVMGEVIEYMRARGFVPYDVLGFQYRPWDGALAQVDLAFTREQGPLRAVQLYATADQRRAQWARPTGRP